MFSQIRYRFQLAILILILCVGSATGVQDEDGFESVPHVFDHAPVEARIENRFCHGRQIAVPGPA